ncbi:hypothetical protein RBB50_008997 [Rhinocladiella similis]
MVYLRPCVITPLVSILLSSAIAGPSDTQVGPLEFYWPVQRPWFSTYQNSGPCGTNATVSTRTDFPLDMGKLSLYAADDVAGLSVRVAYVDDPVSLSSFNSSILEIATFRPGQMCYSVPGTLTVPPNTNGTIQLEYTSWYDGSSRAQTFYACADVTFREGSDVDATFSCLNSTGTEASPNTEISSGVSESAHRRHGLSTGAKVGTAIGCTIGGAVLIAASVFLVLLMRRRKTVSQRDWKPDSRFSWKQMDDSISLHKLKSTP